MQTQASREMTELTAKMQRVTEDGQREAVAVRIITVIALLYLPGTFVSVCRRSFRLRKIDLWKVTLTQTW